MAAHLVVPELHLLSVCALRIDGYAWAVEHGIEREQLMKPFWHAEAREQLFAESWDYQWASWFMQQRSLAWSGTEPSVEIVALWRRLFVELATKRPSPPFDRGGPDGDPTAAREWDTLYARHAASLAAAIRDRMQGGRPIDEVVELWAD
jgi:hypothetical protein